MDQPPLVEMTNICKSYSGIQVMKNVSFSLMPGEIHALVGENGAGKSTLIKVLMGIVPRDDGVVKIGGNEVVFDSAKDAAANGLTAVFQELSLIPTLSVADNILLTNEEKIGGVLLNRAANIAKAQDILDRYNIRVDARTIVSELSTAQRQLTEICKALVTEPKVVIFDEPTSSLTEREITMLFGMIREFKEKGAGIIYISHRMEEIFELTDRITVLRDGSYIGTKSTDETDLDEIITMMVGREVSLYRQDNRREVNTDEVALELRNVGSKTGFSDVSFKLYKGEILGFAGLVGSGRSELMNLIYGIDRITSGSILLDGKETRIASPSHAIKNGICMIPENRHLQGLVLIHSIEENIATANMDTIRSGTFFINYGKVGRTSRRCMEEFDIRADSVKKVTAELSGGNQQKVVIAKWLNRNPKILIVDEPTNGVDVGAKAQIHKILRGLTERGVSIILISSEMPELLNHSDRILVMNSNRIIREYRETTQEQIMETILSDITSLSARRGVS